MRETMKIYELLVREHKAYPVCQLTPEGLTLIAERLAKRYSYAQVEKAMNDLVYQAKFFPSLAEIAEKIEQEKGSPIAGMTREEAIRYYLEKESGKA